MSVICPRGHLSQTTDYCDQCGARVGAGGPGSGADPGATTILPIVEEVDTSPSIRREPCPVCGATRSGDDRFCEGCGHDFLAPRAVAWDALVVADRAQFDRHGVSGVTFPVDYGERRFTLLEGENRIGRGRGGPTEDAPEIDLAGGPIDPGVSRLHAVLEQREDGGCVLRDVGSTNGTFMGDEPAPIPPHTDVPLADGDRIRMGAWTAITLRRRA
jgi:hypothetical protein